MDPTPAYIRFQKTHSVTRPPAGFIDFYYDAALGRFATLSSDGMIHSPEVPDPVPTQWGTIIGTLSAQADLQAVLGEKAPLLNPEFPGYVDMLGELWVGGSITVDANLSVGGALNVTGVATFTQPIVGTLAVVVREASAAGDALLVGDNYLRHTGASDITVTVPDDATLNFPVGTRITLRQAGNGTVLVAEAPGVTIHGQLSTAGRHRSLGLIKVGPNEWDTERGAF